MAYNLNQSICGIYPKPTPTRVTRQVPLYDVVVSLVLGSIPNGAGIMV